MTELNALPNDVISNARVLAILGPSGSGKTVLFDYLRHKYLLTNYILVDCHIDNELRQAIIQNCGHDTMVIFIIQSEHELTGINPDLIFLTNPRGNEFTDTFVERYLLQRQTFQDLLQRYTVDTPHGVLVINRNRDTYKCRPVLMC